MPIQIANYPSAIATFTEKVDLQDINFAAHINALQAEVTAIETVLGTDPQGSSASLKDRLEVLESVVGQFAFSVLYANSVTLLTTPTTGSAYNTPIEVDSSLRFAVTAPNSGTIVVFQSATVLSATGGLALGLGEAQLGVRHVGTPTPDVLELRTVSGSIKTSFDPYNTDVHSAAGAGQMCYVTGLSPGSEYIFEWVLQRHLNNAEATQVTFLGDISVSLDIGSPCITTVLAV